MGIGSFLCHGTPYDAARRQIAATQGRKFTPAQCNYTTTDHELLAIIDVLRVFEYLLLGITFTIITDHMALRTLMSRIITNHRHIRWLGTPKMFRFTVEHIEERITFLRMLYHATTKELENWTTNS